MSFVRSYSSQLAMAAAIAMLTACSTTQVQSPSWTVPPEAKTKTVNGYPMAYTEKGTGETIVLVHGVLVDYRFWRTQVEDWSKQYNVIAVSLRHFYPEPWNGQGSDFTIEQHAADVAAFIESLKKPVYLVGHSYGAHVAYEAAKTHPDLVKRLVLAEAPLDALVQPNMAAAFQIQQDRAKETKRFFQSGDLDGGLKYAVDDINGPGVWDRVPAPSKQVLRENAWTVVGIGQYESPRVTCAEFGSLPMPVLLVKGENTTPRYKTLVTKESECLPIAKLVTIPKAAHGMFLQNPETSKKAVFDFLANR